MKSLKGSLDYKTYISLVENYYKQNNKTTPIQIDSLILLYKINAQDSIFNLLFNSHKRLISKIVWDRYFKYKGQLYQEDFNELQSMTYFEFYRRILHYKLPPQAPFSKYVKLYLVNWTNVYAKIIVKKNNRFVLNVDMDYE